MYIDFAKLKKSPHNGNDAYRLHYVLRSTRVCTYSTCIMVSSATCSLLARFNFFMNAYEKYVCTVYILYSLFIFCCPAVLDIKTRGCFVLVVTSSHHRIIRRTQTFIIYKK